MTNQNGLPDDLDHVYGRSENFRLTGQPDLMGKGKFTGQPNANGAGNRGYGGALNANRQGIRFVSSVVTVELGENQNFQLMPDNPNRVYLAITAISGLTLAFGRSISSSDGQLEYSLPGAGAALFFDTGNAPTCSVNVGVLNPSLLLQVAILEGVKG
jgi:hypothetical protein